MKATGAQVHRKQPVPNANGMTVESYRRCERYITVTGNILPGVPDQIADGDALLDQTVARLDALKQQAKGSRQEAEGGPKRKKRSSTSTTSSRTAKAAISPATVPPRCGG